MAKKNCPDPKCPSNTDISHAPTCLLPVVVLLCTGSIFAISAQVLGSNKAPVILTYINLNKPAFLSFSSYVPCSVPDCLSDSLCWTCSSMSVVFLWGQSPQLGTTWQLRPHKCQTEGKDHFSGPVTFRSLWIATLPFGVLPAPSAWCHQQTCWMFTLVANEHRDWYWSQPWSLRGCH